MPTGVYKRQPGKRYGRGVITTSSSSNTDKIREAMAELEQRLLIEQHKDKGRAKILATAEECGLEPRDLSALAKQLGARPKADRPVISSKLIPARRAHLSRKMTEAMAAKGLRQTDLCKLLKRSSSNVSQWLSGVTLPSAEVQPKLIKALDLPKDFFVEAKPNGAAHG